MQFASVIEVMNPATENAQTSVALSPRLASLEGKTLGILWNGRRPGPGRELLEQAASILKESHALKEVVLVRKPFVGNVAPDEVQDELVGSCDAVMTGIGDWGSCTSGSLLDAIALEKRGVPAVPVGVEKLMMTTGKGMARAHGVPDFPMAIISHYQGQITYASAKDVERYAEEIASQIPACLSADKLP